MSFEMRKVQEIMNGASVSVVLPKDMCINLGIGKGDYVKVSMDKDNKKIVVEKP